MGLTYWDGAPQGKIHKYNVTVAKNYLSEFKLGQMQRIVSAYLDMSEMQVLRKMPMTMADWEERLGGFSGSSAGRGQGYTGNRQGTRQIEFEKYRIVQDRLFESDFDRMIKLTESGGQLDINKE